MKNKSNRKAYHPGSYLKDYIEETHMSISQLADKIDMSIDDANLLLNGKLDVNKEIAKKISSMMGTSVELWLNLQCTYNVYANYHNS